MHTALGFAEKMQRGKYMKVLVLPDIHLKTWIFDRADTYKQVVGHTPVERIFEKDGIISTDVFSTYRDGTQIGESAMIVIDSETGEYEKMSIAPIMLA